MIKLESGTYLWQWNTGQRLIVDYPAGTVVDITANQADAIAREAYNEGGTIYVDIPNILLQSAGRLYIYVQRMEATRVTTVLEACFAVRAQPKPPDYITDEAEALTWHQLDERLSRLEEAGAGGPVPYIIGAGLKLVTNGASKTLEVDSADAVEKDNSLPITSAAVYTAVGNIDALLSII